MAELQAALESLGPISYDSLPTSEHTELRSFLHSLYGNSLFVVESVPQPPPSKGASTGTTFSGCRISTSDARADSLLPSASSLQKEWGKPVNKVENARDNPLQIPLYKLAGKDGKGAWFARRSVHEGLGFSTWKRKMQEEFPETGRMRKESLDKGGPGEQTIRGLGCDRVVESFQVREDGTTGTTDKPLGKVEVLHLSARFPGPATPRDFIPLLITSDTAVERAADDAGVNGGRRIPRSYMVVSKPCEHPDAAPRNSFIRGQYESVEFIREIPVRQSNSQRPPTRLANKSESNLHKQIHAETVSQEDPKAGRRRSKTVDALQLPNNADGEDGVGDDDTDSNPVEWIMITRSDPGGSVPRWMVERGTPGSIIGDASKFLEWACQNQGSKENQDLKMPSPQKQESHVAGRLEAEASREADTVKAALESDEDDAPDSIRTDTEDESDEYRNSEEHHGLIASVTGLVNAGLEMYAPTAVLDYIPGYSPRPLRNVKLDDDSDDDDLGSTVGSFASAKTHEDRSQVDTAPLDRASLDGSRPGTVSPVESTVAESRETAQGQHLPLETKAEPSSYEKDMAKLADRKRRLETELASVREKVAQFDISQSQPQPQVVEQGPSEDANGSLKPSPESSIKSSIKSGSNDKADEAYQSTDDAKKQRRRQEEREKKQSTRLSRQENKIVSQIQKVEANQLKLASKIENKQRKDAEKEKNRNKNKDKNKNKTEVDALKSEIKRLNAEARDLRAERGDWVKLIGRLQKENTRLVAEMKGENNAFNHERKASSH